MSFGFHRPTPKNRRRASRAAWSQCLDCGGARAEGIKLCAHCAERRRSAERKYRYKVPCPLCGGPTTSSRCRACYLKQKAEP